MVGQGPASQCHIVISFSDQVSCTSGRVADLIMAATLASLWEKKKKLQPNHATKHVDLTVPEDPTCNTEATNRGSQPDVSDCLCEYSQVPAPVPAGSSKQSQGPDKKRKRAQLLSSGLQPSTEEINSAAKKAAVPEQLANDWLSEQHDTQAKKANLLPQTAIPAAPMQHDPDSSTPAVGAHRTQSSSLDGAVLAAAKTAQAFDEHVEVASQHHSGVAQQASEGVSTAQLTHPNEAAHSEPSEGTSKQHLHECYQAELQQFVQQAQAAKPMADLPLFTDGQMNRAEVRTDSLRLPSSFQLAKGHIVHTPRF